MVLLVTDHKQILRSAFIEKQIDSQNVDLLIFIRLQYIVDKTKIWYIFE